MLIHQLSEEENNFEERMPMMMRDGKKRFPSKFNKTFHGIFFK